MNPVTDRYGWHGLLLPENIARSAALCERAPRAELAGYRRNTERPCPTAYLQQTSPRNYGRHGYHLLFLRSLSPGISYVAPMVPRSLRRLPCHVKVNTTVNSPVLLFGCGSGREGGVCRTTEKPRAVVQRGVIDRTFACRRRPSGSRFTL